MGGGGGGGLAHDASRLASEAGGVESHAREGSRNGGNAPGLMPRGFLPRGKRREAGRDSALMGFQTP